MASQPSPPPDVYISCITPPAIDGGQLRCLINTQAHGSRAAERRQIRLGVGCGRVPFQRTSGGRRKTSSRQPLGVPARAIPLIIFIPWCNISSMTKTAFLPPPILQRGIGALFVLASGLPLGPNNMSLWRTGLALLCNQDSFKVKHRVSFCKHGQTKDQTYIMIMTRAQNINRTYGSIKKMTLE